MKASRPPGWEEAQAEAVRRDREENERYQRTLAEIRKARQHTQTALAERLGITQGRVAQIEKGADLYLTTLARYVEGLGGEIEIFVRFGEERMEINVDHLIARDEEEARDLELAAGGR